MKRPTLTALLLLSFLPMLHAQGDKSVPVLHSVVFYRALAHHRVPAALHLYPRGGYGFGLHNPTPPNDWMERLHNWLTMNG